MSMETLEGEGLAGKLRSDQWTLQWTPIVAGALAACAVSSIMITFAASVGLGVSSTAPTWRDASIALWVLSGIYLILQALISFGCGGYLAGRVRSPYAATEADQVERQDGLHGIASWALAVILATALAALVTGSISRPNSLTQHPPSLPRSATRSIICSARLAGHRATSLPRSVRKQGVS